MIKKITFICLLLFVAVGCQAPATGPAEPAPETPEKAQEVEMSIPETFNHPHVTDAIVQLTAQLDIPADQIEIIKAEPKVWPDSSMGCPKPGLMYMQVLVEDGMYIQLKANGTSYDFHSGNGQKPFLCEAHSTS